jgi:NAD(P)-dependent dehydrogenase (short-subunit alcohol dehydrogenase family)
MCPGLAERGARVVIARRKIDACEELAAQIRASGFDAFAAACHVGAGSAVSEWPQAAA